MSGPCPIGVGPCARHFHWRAVSQTHNQHLPVGIEYFEFMVVQGMAPPGYLYPRRRIVEDILSV